MGQNDGFEEESVNMGAKIAAISIPLVVMAVKTPNIDTINMFIGLLSHYYGQMMVAIGKENTKKVFQYVVEMSSELDINGTVQ